MDLFWIICIQKPATFLQLWMHLNYAEGMTGYFHYADVSSTNASNCWIFVSEKVSL